MNTKPQATPDQVSRLKTQFPILDSLLNPFQIDTLAAHIDTVVAEHDNRDMTVIDLLRHFETTDAFDEAHLTDIVIQINLFYLNRDMDTSIEQFGFTKLFVFSETPADAQKTTSMLLSMKHLGLTDDQKNSIFYKPNFYYTVGLSLKTGFELIAIAETSDSNLSKIIEAYSRKALHGEDITQEDTSLFLVEIDNQKVGLRTKAVKVDPQEARKEHICQVRNEVFDVYQLYFADKNNVFPDEPGYDEACTQPLFSRV